MALMEVRERRSRPTATWYDDEPEKVARYRIALERGSNYHIVIRAPGDLNDVEAVDELNFVDLDIKRATYDGVQLARKLVSINPRTRIVFVSRYLAQARFENVDRQIAPTTRISFLEKTDLADASLPEDNSTDNLIIEQGVRAVKDAVSRVNLAGELLGAPPKVLEDEMARFTAEAFYAMPKVDQAQIVLEARVRMATYLTEMFASHSDVSWILIGVPSAEVIKWGSAGDQEPTDKATIIRDARESLNPSAVPIVFHRPRYRH